MIFKSIKWRLQIWYGLILVVVLAGFGITAFQLERGRVLRRIDDELHRRADALANIFRPPPGRGREPLPRGEQPRGPRQFQGPEFAPPEGEQRGPEADFPFKNFQLPRHLVGLFDETDTNGFYYILLRNGVEIARSSNAPLEAPLVPRFSGGPPPRMDAHGLLPPITTRGDLREIMIFAPPLANNPPQRMPYLSSAAPNGIWIVIGRSIAPELNELNFAALRLAVVGANILLLGLAGGWWIAGRAIRPIKDISATAVKISAGDLSQRISTTDAESELGQLSAVLNSTFARLDAAFVQQQQFTSDAAHELRTPVSVMLTQTQSALNRERSAAEYRETVEACQRAAQRMRRLIESLLELARFDAGQEQLKRLKFDFSKTVNDCVLLVKPLADECGVKIHGDLASIECVGDSERLAQVVTNLLTNAIQYNNPGGEVNVKLEIRGGVALLTVSNTGQGISSEDLPRVFERFYRADKSRSAGGNGLGLAISKAIVEAHGGMIEVASDAGAGTTFSVRLPISLK